MPAVCKASCCYWRYRVVMKTVETETAPRWRVHTAQWGEKIQFQEQGGGFYRMLPRSQWGKGVLIKAFGSGKAAVEPRGLERWQSREIERAEARLREAEKWLAGGDVDTAAVTTLSGGIAARGRREKWSLKKAADLSRNCGGWRRVCALLGTHWEKQVQSLPEKLLEGVAKCEGAVPGI